MTEKIEVKRDKSKPQRNSGRSKTMKGDAVMGEILYDIKEYAKSFSVTRDVWAKICTDAYTAGSKIPALKIVLGEKDNKIRLWVIEDSVFKDMLEAWVDKQQHT
jgi:hypothetical protein